MSEVHKNGEADAKDRRRHHDEYRLLIDNHQHKWPREFINGLQIKELARVDPATYSVWEVVRGPGEDIEIGDQQEVDLKGHEKRFITGKKHSTEG
jgi:Multiubiquitin